jgi:hypothetical protein
LAALAIFLGFLTLFGAIRLWMILVLAFLNGTLRFDQPIVVRSFRFSSQKNILGTPSVCRQYFLRGLTIGPALAGFSVATLGYAGNFF